MEFNCGVHILRARFQVKIFIGLELIKQVFEDPKHFCSSGGFRAGACVAATSVSLMNARSNHGGRCLDCERSTRCERGGLGDGAAASTSRSQSVCLRLSPSHCLSICHRAFKNIEGVAASGARPWACNHACARACVRVCMCLHVRNEMGVASLPCLVRVVRVLSL